jgi:hypothetical protein
MAARKKSAKRAARKTRAGSQRASARKKPLRKATSKRRGKASSTSAKRKTNLKSKAAKGLRAARKGIGTVRQAGERTWELLKSTTGQVVEGVRGKVDQSSDPDARYR